MSEMILFSHSDDVIFHGIAGDSRGFTYGDARNLKSDNDRIQHLQTRMEGYYVGSLADIGHPFTSTLLVCVGIEVLGQIILGTSSKGGSERDLTIDIYHLLDDSFKASPSEDFISAFDRKCDPRGTGIRRTANWNTVAEYVIKGMRNTYMHNYRSMGVLLDDANDEILQLDEAEGVIILNPTIFRTRFIDLWNRSFDACLDGSNPSYREKALEYFKLIIE